MIKGDEHNCYYFYARSRLFPKHPRSTETESFRHPMQESRKTLHNQVVPVEYGVPDPAEDPALNLAYQRCDMASASTAGSVDIQGFQNRNHE